MHTYFIVAEGTIDGKFQAQAQRMVAHAANLLGLDEWVATRWFVPAAQARAYQTTGETFTDAQDIGGRADPKQQNLILVRYDLPLDEALQTVAHEVAHLAQFRSCPGFAGALPAEAEKLADELAADAWVTFDPTNTGELLDYIMRSLQAEKRQAPKAGVKPEWLAGLRRIGRLVLDAHARGVALAKDPAATPQEQSEHYNRYRELIARFNVLAEACGYGTIPDPGPLPDHQGGQGKPAKSRLALAGQFREERERCAASILRANPWLNDLPPAQRAAFVRVGASETAVIACFGSRTAALRALK